MLKFFPAKNSQIFSRINWMLQFLLVDFSLKDRIGQIVDSSIQLLFFFFNVFSVHKIYINLIHLLIVGVISDMSSPLARVMEMRLIQLHASDHLHISRHRTSSPLSLNRGVFLRSNSLDAGSSVIQIIFHLIFQLFLTFQVVAIFFKY